MIIIESKRKKPATIWKKCFKTCAWGIALVAVACLLLMLICNQIVVNNGPDIQMRVYNDHVEIWNDGELPEGYDEAVLFQ